ncbi:unnamed protein product, partial [Brassica oleracea]
MTIILNGRVECMKSHQQRTTLQSAGYQYLETKLAQDVSKSRRNTRLKGASGGSGGSGGERVSGDNSGGERASSGGSDGERVSSGGS